MKVRVTRTVTLPVTPTATAHYPVGFVGRAPREHVRRIVAAGAGERLPDLGDEAPPAAATALEKKRRA